MGRSRIIPCNNRKKEAGAALIEMVITAPIFMMLIFLAIDLGRMSYNAVALQYALNKTARWTIIGETLEDPANTGTQLSRLDSLYLKLQTIASDYGTTVATGDIHVCPIAVTNCPAQAVGANSLPGSGEMFKISVTFPSPFFFGWEDFIIVRTAIGKNEYF